MKEIRLSDHAKQKIEILANHEIALDLNFIIETVRSPDVLETGEENKLIAQKYLNENLVLEFLSAVCKVKNVPYKTRSPLDLKSDRGFFLLTKNLFIGISPLFNFEPSRR